MVDVLAQLEARAKANPQKLNWRTSIVDLLKLLDIDSSLEARKTLARELNAPDDVMGAADQMAFVADGDVIAAGAPADVLRKGRDARIDAFIG